ncbi:MAG: hypothetical protein BWY19_00307 [bacterium ADurb.Bin212]|nr:MAG: hypothetical protein BWY19_00307 [bacterium ADurb.Bin212]
MEDFDFLKFDNESNVSIRLKRALLSIGFSESNAGEQVDQLLSIIGAKIDLMIEAQNNDEFRLDNQGQSDEEMIEDIKRIASSTVQDYVREVLDGLTDKDKNIFIESFDSI